MKHLLSFLFLCFSFVAQSAIYGDQVEPKKSG